MPKPVKIVLVFCALVFMPVLRAETITGVTFAGTATAPTITIFGSGFGIEPTATSLALTGYTGYDYGTNLQIYDIKPSVGYAFSSGYDDPSHGLHDFIGLNVTSYSDTAITYQLGSAYNLYYSERLFQLNSGDSFYVNVKGTTYSGNVGYTPEPGSLLLTITGLSSIVAAGTRRLYQTSSLTP